MPAPSPVVLAFLALLAGIAVTPLGHARNDLLDDLLELPAPPPLDRVARLLDADVPALAKAAEAYLIAEDSARARRLVLARHPGVALILGARERFDSLPDAYSRFGRWEHALRTEVRRADGPDEIIALLCGSNWGDGERIIIRRHAEKAVVYRYIPPEPGVSDETFSARQLTADDWNALTDFVSKHRIEELAPQLMSVFDGPEFEFVRLNRDGGWRVFMRPNGPDGTLYDQLVQRVEALAPAAPVPTPERDTLN